MLFITRILKSFFSIADFGVHNFHKIKLIIIMVGFIKGAYAQVYDTILIENENVIPMDKEVVLNNQNILIAGDKIISIGLYKPVFCFLFPKYDLIDGEW